MTSNASVPNSGTGTTPEELAVPGIGNGKTSQQQQQQQPQYLEIPNQYQQMSFRKNNSDDDDDPNGESGPGKNNEADGKPRNNDSGGHNVANGGVNECRSPVVESTSVPANVAVPPDGGWGWVVVIASFYCNLVVDGIIYSYSTLHAGIKNDFQENDASILLVVSLLSGTYLFTGPFASALANRYGFRSVTILGSLISSIGFIISSYSHSVMVLYITYGILGGVGFGLIFVPSVITIGFYFEKWRALATGIAVCGSGVGTYVMSEVSEYVLTWSDWRGALRVHAGLIGGCAIAGLLFRPLKTLSIEIPVPIIELNNASDDNGESKSKKPNTNGTESHHLLLQRQIFDDSKDRLPSRHGSVLNIYEDVGLTVDPIGATSTDAKANNQYPTAAQILQLDVISDEEQAVTCAATQPVSESEDYTTDSSSHPHQELVPPNACKSNDKLSVLPMKGMLVKSKSVSSGIQHQQRKHNLATETRILLNHNRKFSLQPQAITQSMNLKPNSQQNGLNKVPSNQRLTSRRPSEISNRPLYRDDIFFNSSLNRLPIYNEKVNSLTYTMSVTRLPTTNDIMEEIKTKKNLSIRIPEAIQRALATLFEFGLLKSPTFILLAVSGFLTAVGMYTPLLYIEKRANLNNEMPAELAIWLLKVFGIANTFGRIGFGIISSIPRINVININNASISICGLFTMLSGLSMQPWFQFAYISTFGITLACFSSLRTIIVVELLGLEKLTNAFGLLLLFQGVGAIIGPPLAGALFDFTNSYTLPFLVSGTVILISAAICYPIKLLNNRVLKKIEPKKKKISYKS